MTQVAQAQPAPQHALDDIAEIVRDDGVNRILATVRGHLGLEIAYVARYVGDERQLTHVDSDLDLPMGPGHCEDKAEGYCWHVLQGNLPELIQDPKDHPFTQTMAITDFLPVGAHVNTPLRLSDGTVWGSFCALSRQPDRTITPRDLSVLKAFAGLAAERIESAMETDATHSRLRRTIEQLLAGQQLSIHHQPIHSLSDDAPAGVECLSRFPDAANKGPDKWFDEAGEVGLGVELEMLAIRCALETMPYVPSHMYMSVNASPETILSGALDGALDGYDASRLVLEVTEHQRIDDFAALAKGLDRVRGKARIAIDDVGAGYAGLRHIVDLKPDLLKLDMSLTRDIHLDAARRALTGAMVMFAKEIGCKLVAEGIECDEERATLRELGVEYGQGYFYSRPLPVLVAQQNLMGVGKTLETEPREAELPEPDVIALQRIAGRLS